LLLNGVAVHVVSQRIGHANPAITLRVYAHVIPAAQQEAAQRFAAAVEGG
jgi:integrase